MPPSITFPKEKVSIAWTSNASRVPMEQILDDVLDTGYMPPHAAR